MATIKVNLPVPVALGAASLFLMACQTRIDRASEVALRSDGSYLSEPVANPSGPASAPWHAFHVYPDLEAVYVSTSLRPTGVDQALRDGTSLGSGGCLLDGVRLDCRFIQRNEAWALCGAISTDAVSLTLRPVGVTEEAPTDCPAEGRLVFRFVPQR